MNYQAPFFVFEDDDLSIFADMASLTSKLEPIDIEQNVYEIYDALGSRLRFIPTQIQRKGIFGTTIINSIAFDGVIDTDLALFTQTLRHYCHKVWGVDMSSAPVDELMAFVIAKDDYTR